LGETLNLNDGDWYLALAGYEWEKACKPIP